MKFKYADVVEVTEGFYEGQKGIVTCVKPSIAIFGKIIYHNHEYGIELEDDWVTVEEKQLKLLRREKGKDVWN